METAGGTLAIRILVASIALLLSGGALSAAVVDSPPSSSEAAGEAVRAPEAVQPTIPEVTTTTTTAVAAPTTTFPPPTTAASPTTRRPSPPTTSKAVTTSVVASARPPIRTTTTIANIRPATSWQADKNGVSARVHIEPAQPSAGQPVRFVIDVSSAEACCIILVTFGDGSVGASNLTEVCGGVEQLDPGSTTFETTNTYAAPGAYRATLSLDAGGPCPQSAPPGGRAGTPDVIIEACFAVGPGTAGQAGCTPFGPR